MSVTLQPAIDLDCTFFRLVRNEPTVCRMSRRGEVSQEDHEKWWKTTTDARYVVVNKGVAVGTLRISGEGLISIALLPQYRGLGIGSDALKEAVRWCKELGHKVLTAEVLPQNLPSQRAFLKAGWRPVLFEMWL